MNKIKAITFDLDDTLWPLKPTLIRAEKETYQWLKTNASKLTDKYSLKEMGAYRFKIFKENNEYRHQISKVRIATILQLAQESGYSETLAKEIAEQSFQIHYQLRQAVNCYDGVEEMLQQLSESYLLGAISNGNANASKTNIGQYFSFTLSAEQVNASKPDQTIFLTALKKIDGLLGAKTNAEEVVHVGDDFYCDIIGAKRVNFKAIWFDNVKADSISSTTDKKINHTNYLKNDGEASRKDKSGAKQPKSMQAADLNIEADAVIKNIQDLPTVLNNI